MEALLSRCPQCLKASTIADGCNFDQFLTKFGTIRRPQHLQLKLSQILQALNGGWIPTPVLNPPIALDCFRFAQMTISGEPAVDLIAIASSVIEKQSPQSNKFIVNEKGLGTLLNLAPRIYAIQAVTLQIYGKGETICERCVQLQSSMGSVFADLLHSTVGAMIPFIPTQKEGTPMMLPIWGNSAIAGRQGRIAAAVTASASASSSSVSAEAPVAEKNDRTMFISLAGLCGPHSAAMPYVYVAPLKEEKIERELITHRAGEKVPTEVLRESSIFTRKIPLANTGGCLSFGHMGTMPVYIGFSSDGPSSSVSVFGHIHSSRFKLRPEWDGHGSPFDINGTTLTPCRVDAKTILGWADTFPAGVPEEIRKAGKASIREAIKKGGIESVPNLPMGMYGPRFCVTDAALVEAMHWWAAFVQALAGQTVGETRILGMMEQTGVVTLVIPEIAIPIVVAGQKFFGGVVVIMPEGDHASCLYMRDDGCLTANAEEVMHSPRSVALYASIAAFITISGKRRFSISSSSDAAASAPTTAASASAAASVSSASASASASASVDALSQHLMNKCYEIYISPSDIISEIHLRDEICSTASVMHCKFLSEKFDCAWKAALDNEESVKVLFREIASK